MSLPEQGGKVASSIVDSLKGQPALLALFICNLGMLVFLFYALSAAGNFRSRLIEQNYIFQHQVADILSRCIVPRSQHTDGQLPPVEKIAD
jgi:hypothetical protein